MAHLAQLRAVEAHGVDVAAVAGMEEEHVRVSGGRWRGARRGRPQSQEFAPQVAQHYLLACRVLGTPLEAGALAILHHDAVLDQLLGGGIAERYPRRRAPARNP